MSKTEEVRVECFGLAYVTRVRGSTYPDICSIAQGMSEWVSEVPGQEVLRAQALQTAVDLSTRTRRRRGKTILAFAKAIHAFGVWQPKPGALLPPTPDVKFLAGPKPAATSTPVQPQSRPRQPRPRPVAVPAPEPVAPRQVAVGAEDEPLSQSPSWPDPSRDSTPPASPAKPTRTTGPSSITRKKKTGGKKTTPRSR